MDDFNSNMDILKQGIMSPISERSLHDEEQSDLSDRPELSPFAKYQMIEATEIDGDRSSESASLGTGSTKSSITRDRTPAVTIADNGEVHVRGVTPLITVQPPSPVDENRTCQQPGRISGEIPKATCTDEVDGSANFGTSETELVPTPSLE
jgi:hypothetical protein